MYVFIEFQYYNIFVATEMDCGLPPDKPFGGSFDWNGIDTTYSTAIT